MTPVRRTRRAPQVQVETAPAYEFLISVAAATDTLDAETYDLGAAWRREIAERAGSDLMDRINQVAHGETDVWLNLVALAYEAPAPRDVAAFLEHLQATDADEIRLHAIAFYSRDLRRSTDPEVIRRAVSGEPEAIAEFMRTSHPEWEPWQSFLAGFLPHDPDAFKAELIESLTLWDERVWAPVAGEIVPILERDAEAKREMAGKLPLEEFVVQATNGVDFLPRPGIGRVVMIPSYLERPLVSHSEVADTLFVTYPVADESVAADRDVPPLRLVRLSKALGDEKRLRILRALADGEKGLMDLAEQFGVPKTTMHHHLIVLRSAGLVSVALGSKRYRLRHETVPDVGALLSGYLGAGPGPSSAPGPASPPAAPARRRRGPISSRSGPAARAGATRGR